MRSNDSNSLQPGASTPRGAWRRSTRTVRIGVAAGAAAAIAAGVLALSAAPGTGSASQAAVTDSAGQAASHHGGLQRLTVNLQAMPAGTVRLRHDGPVLAAQVSAFGLTPGSSHAVELRRGGAVLARFTTLAASSTGSVSQTLIAHYPGFVPGGSSVVILNGAADDGGIDSQVIAASLAVTAGFATSLRAVDGPLGLAVPAGTATFVADPARQTLTVTVNAAGFTPGAHAAHIHDGSCAVQGAVQTMLTDLTANGAGRIVNETRVITGWTTPLPAAGLYLNIHQGTSSQILDANGQPTIFFRPLLCAGI